MRLIINIDEDVYTRLFDNGIQDNEIAVDDVCEMARALRRGTPLPKGCGKIGDIDELQTTICNKSASISDLTILKGVYFALQVIEDYMGGSRAWIANVPFVTGLSADSADVPECETWSNNEKMQYIDYNEAYPFIDEDGRHYRVSYIHTKIYADEEKPEHYSSNTNELVRDCDNCTHYTTVKGKTGCES